MLIIPAALGRKSPFLTSALITGHVMRCHLGSGSTGGAGAGAGVDGGGGTDGDGGCGGGADNGFAGGRFGQITHESDCAARHLLPGMVKHVQAAPEMLRL